MGILAAKMIWTSGYAARIACATGKRLLLSIAITVGAPEAAWKLAAVARPPAIAMGLAGSMSPMTKWAPSFRAPYCRRLVPSAVMVSAFTSRPSACSGTTSRPLRSCRRPSALIPFAASQGCVGLAGLEAATSFSAVSAPAASR